MYRIKFLIQTRNPNEIVLFRCLFWLHSDFYPKKKYILGLGSGCGPKPKTIINSKFNSIHFGIEFNSSLKFFIFTQKCLGLKGSFSHFLEP